MELSELKYPSMREELIDYLRGLSDRDYQYQSWVYDKCPGGGHDELDYAIHFLFDDTDLATDPESDIGGFLLNKKEAELMANLIDRLNYIFDKYSLNLADREYIEKPEWEDVIQAAIKARDCLCS
jgi:hypothetical protein